MWQDEKYINMIAGGLSRFKKTGNSYNFKCPLCGDSEKNKMKARGYFIPGNTGYVYYCHNCHVSISFAMFLSQRDQALYNAYLMEKFESKKPVYTPKKINLSKPPKLNVFRSLIPINKLSEDHPAKTFLRSRMIPYDNLYYAENFQEWTNTVIPNKFEKPPSKDPRIVIPLQSKTETFGFQGRSITNNDIRYITVLFEGQPKLFGMDRINLNTKYYVVEGPFDSLLLKNAVATCGGVITSCLDRLLIDNAVIVYDNEPRNPDIIRNIQKAISIGFRVVIWPKNIYEKDINDMLLSYPSDNSLPFDEHIEALLANRTFKGLAAELELKNWRKC